MSPELNRSDDRGGELATTGQAAQPATGREISQSPPSSGTGRPADDTRQNPAESDQGVGESDQTAGQSGALAATLAAAESATVPGPGQAAAGDRDAAGVQAMEPAADQTEDAVLADAARLHAGWRRIQAGFVDDPREAVADTEQLRLVMQRYRSLFDQLCRP